MHKPAHDRVISQRPVPDKLFYKIGEVSKIAGVEPYVLRYWETEFPFINPRKNKSGQRVYTRKDLDLVIQVKRMLHQERYTIEGVRKRFSEGFTVRQEQKTNIEHKVRSSQNPAEIIKLVKKRLKDILSLIK